MQFHRVKQLQDRRDELSRELLVYKHRNLSFRESLDHLMIKEKLEYIHKLLEGKG